MRRFLESRYDKILHVTAVINNHSIGLTIKEIAEKVDLSLPSVRKIIEGLEEHLLSNKENLLIECSNKKMIRVRANNYPLQKLAELYLEESLLYLMVRTLLEERRISSSKFCECYAVSDSSFSRHRIELKKILQSMGLDLNRENELVGSETLIRSFFVVFFRYSHSEWIFSFSTYFELEHLLSKIYPDWTDLTDNERRMTYLIFYVAIKRISQKQFFDDCAFLKLYQQFEGTEFVHQLQRFFMKKGLSKQQTYLEIAYILFFLRKDELMINNMFKSRMDDILLADNEVFLQKLQQILPTVLPEISWDDTLLSQLPLMNLIIKKSYIPYHYFYYIYDKENFFCFDEREKQLLAKMKVLVEHILADEQLAKYYQTFLTLYSAEELVNYYFTIFYENYSSTVKQNRPVTIFIEHSKFMNRSILSNRLQTIFDKTIHILDTYDETADLIVSDLSTTAPLHNTLAVSSYSDEKDFELLLLKILTIRRQLVSDFWKRSHHQSENNQTKIS